MTIRAKCRIVYAKFRTYPKFMHMKCQPELKPFGVQTNLYLSRFQKETNKKTTKESSVETYFKAS